MTRWYRGQERNSQPLLQFHASQTAEDRFELIFLEQFVRGYGATLVVVFVATEDWCLVKQISILAF
jgi:hypothetical protein